MTGKVKMANKILNWGLLSTARINRALIPPLQVSKRNHLLAVGSRSQETADAYAKEKKIERAYGSYEALLADPDIDVIYNPLPNHLHAEWTIKAVQAGKHVLCEKPLALSVDEVDAIHSAARQHGRVVAEAFMYRHHPQTLKVQELVKSGSLGTVKLIRGSFGFFLDREEDIRLLDPAMGGGSIWDVGCYPISYARAVLGGNPLEVFGWQVAGKSGVDLTFVGQMKFSNNVLAHIDCSFDIPLYWGVEILGSEGSLKIPSPFKPQVNEKIYLTRGDDTETIKVKGQELYIGEVEDMADAILLGHDPLISLNDSRANVAVITALLESARVGKPVQPDYGNL
jgi:predicted dehydrogenase